MSTNYIDFGIYSIAIILCIFITYFIPKPTSDKKYEFFDRNYTSVYKGFAILTVVWAHAGGKEYNIDGIQWIAGIGVCIFLICSGYGLNESYKRNGLTGYWKKKIIGTLLPYYFVYIICGFIYRGTADLTKEYILSVLMLREQWFIGYIFICYLIFYVVKLISKRKAYGKKVLIIFAFIFAVWFVLDSLFIATGDNYMTRSRQMLSFVFGLAISEYYGEMVDVVKKLRTIIICLCIGLLFMALTNIGMIKAQPIIVKNILSLFTVLPISISLLGIGIRCERLLHSEFLMFIGRISFEIYLTEYFVRKTIGISSLGDLLVCFAVTILVSVGLHWIIERITVNTKSGNI